MDSMKRNKISSLYRSMHLIRRIEEHIVRVYETDVIKSPVHLSIGQEWIASASCLQLNHSDYVINTYRSHASYIAKGGNINKLMAELYGKENGLAGGKAGSMHLFDLEQNILASSAVVGTTIPVGAGWALAQKWDAQKKNQNQNIVLNIFGDGATEEGCFSETLNFAALHSLPMVFLCENNGLAIHQKLDTRWATRRLVERVETYGIKSHRVSSGDIFELYELIGKTYDEIRYNKAGPCFIEVDAYRWLEHVGPTDDHDEYYRDPTAYQLAKESDQLAKISSLIHKDERVLIDQEIEETLAMAIKFAEHSNFPNPNQLYEYNYV